MLTMRMTGLQGALQRMANMVPGIQTRADAVLQAEMAAVATKLRAVTPARSGVTAASIRVRRAGLGYRLVANDPVIDYLLEGTPRDNPGARIYPTAARALAFRIDGRLIIVKSVRGTKPNVAMNAVLDAAVAGSSIVASRVGAAVVVAR